MKHRLVEFRIVMDTAAPMVALRRIAKKWVDPMRERIEDGVLARCMRAEVRIVHATRKPKPKRKARKAK